MQATGIIAEYNPFHNGHLYHIQETKRLTQQPVIVIMSGSFMQRGEPAILSKWQRASCAVQGGADLVLELPCVFTLRSAEFFAKGAVQLLAATGCVNTLACGTEHPQSDFEAAASLACSAEAQARLRELLQNGLSYAQAWEKILGANTAFRTPNDILALEYTKALLQTAADIQPLYLQRTDEGYNSTSIGSSIASASAIRRAMADVGRQYGNAAFSMGAMQGDFGVGASYDLGRDFRLYSQLYDFDDLKVRLGGEFRLHDNLSLYGETMDVRGNKANTYMGVRTYF